MDGIIGFVLMGLEYGRLAEPAAIRLRQKKRSGFTTPLGLSVCLVSSPDEAYES